MDEVAGILFPRAATVILTEPPTTRAISAQLIAQMTDHLAPRVEIAADPEEALNRALALAAPQDAVFVAGSLYLVGALRRYWFLRARRDVIPRSGLGDEESRSKDLPRLQRTP